MKSTSRTLFLLIGITAMLSSNPVFAQHDHSSHGGAGHAEMDRPPHGGELKEVGKYRIEMIADMLLAQDQLRFYLFKGKLKPVHNTDITATITFDRKGEEATTEPLRIYGNDGFAATLKNTEPFRCTVNFIIKGKTVSTYFVHKGLGNGMASIYTCPMHPDIQGDAPGKCPKCGMFLEKQ